MVSYLRTYSYPLIKSRMYVPHTKCEHRQSSYTQGQLFNNRTREYFYYIDHQGMLFLDDARMKNFTSCFKDKTFLAFFFKRLRKNATDRYKEFPYISPCGLERNYVRCDDLPIVFTKVIQNKNPKTNTEEDWFSYAHADNLLMVPFEPEKLFMNIQTGRIYHPAPEKVDGIGLVRSKLAIEFSGHFTFNNGEQQPPTHFTWKGKKYELDTKWYESKNLKQDVKSKLKMMKSGESYINVQGKSSSEGR